MTTTKIQIDEQTWLERMQKDIGMTQVYIPAAPDERLPDSTVKEVSRDEWKAWRDAHPEEFPLAWDITDDFNLETCFHGQRHEDTLIIYYMRLNDFGEITGQRHRYLEANDRDEALYNHARFLVDIYGRIRRSGREPSPCLHKIRPFPLPLHLLKRRGRGTS